MILTFLIIYLAISVIASLYLYIKIKEEMYRYKTWIVLLSTFLIGLVWPWGLYVTLRSEKFKTVFGKGR